MPDFKKFFTDRRYAFLALALIISAAALVHMFPWRIFFFWSPLAVTVTKSKSPISSLDSARNTDYYGRIMVPTVDFPDGYRLRHRLLGNLQAGRNFYMDIETALEVIVAGDYAFYVRSDDGYRLTIGGNQVGGHAWSSSTQDEKTNTVRLERGNYRVRLSYYQADGPLGLRVSYGKAGEYKSWLLGQSSPFLKFRRP